MATARAELILRAEGKAFAHRKYDLRKVDAVLSNYRLILDHALPWVVGQQRLTEKLREQVTYQIEFRPGSLEVLLDLVVASAPVFAVLSADGGIELGEKVAKLIQSVIKFRRAWAKLCDSTEHDRTPKPTLNFNVTLTDVTVSNGSTININPIVLPVAEATKGAIDRLVGSK
jgi:hypothetical protein